MSAEAKVICDGCGRDITTTGNSLDYRLRLTSESKTPWFVAQGQTMGAVTDLMIYPAIQGDKHFCDLGCLGSWMEQARG